LVGELRGEQEKDERRLDNLLTAGLSVHDYAVTAAISMAAIGLSPGAEVLES